MNKRKVYILFCLKYLIMETIDRNHPMGTKLFFFLLLLFLAGSGFAIDCLGALQYDVAAAMNTYQTNEVMCHAVGVPHSAMCHYENELVYNQNFQGAIDNYNACCIANGGPGC